MAINTPFAVTEVDETGRAIGAVRYATTLASAQTIARQLIRQAPANHQVYAFKIFAHVEIDVTYNVVQDTDPTE